ncbi:5'-methylthioadenosine/S-adenosylhomocysteine nucleosidase [Spiroplasma sp. SV19]|uniref:5'-methylthioadenosine/S-adenosylhomocysteine nucleosidase n=1 Tax=Spiroplasma sp. SV19 TaxID=2570468 RepID=UPI0024B7A910|nr:5'-methylthioadenosine/S-adenosylhomocysteine nucleosidase [Spiroplasma sp. SV19]WHQ36517.1 5'-methylthioadenosine/S-adenosylhomocysteine nucleosidase [Spiroplasma sp. SV19]
MNLVISAMEAELSATIAALQPTEVIKYNHIKLYQKGTWLFAISKIGLVNAAMSLATLINDYAIKTIYNVGTVGSLKKTMPLLSVLLISEAYYTFADTRAFGYTVGQIPGELSSYHSDKALLALAKTKILDSQQAVLGSSDIFIDKAEYFDHIKTKFNNKIDVVDMEGTAFFQVAAKHQLPMISIKIVSDYLELNGDSADSQFEKNLPKASLLIYDVIMKFLTD